MSPHRIAELVTERLGRACEQARARMMAAVPVMSSPALSKRADHVREQFEHASRLLVRHLEGNSAHEFGERDLVEAFARVGRDVPHFDAAHDEDAAIRATLLGEPTT